MCKKKQSSQNSFFKSVNRVFNYGIYHPSDFNTTLKAFHLLSYCISANTNKKQTKQFLQRVENYRGKVCKKLKFLGMHQRKPLVDAGVEKIILSVNDPLKKVGHIHVVEGKIEEILTEVKVGPQQLPMAEIWV